MSWGVTAKGSIDDVRAAFDKYAEEQEGKMSDEQLSDVRVAQDFVVANDAISFFPELEVVAGGHWDKTADGPIRTSFYVNVKAIL